MTRPITLPALLGPEIAIGSTINVAFNLFAAWISFPAGSPIRMWGSPGLALDLLPATIIPAVAMTFPISIILRHRLRGGLHVVAYPSPPVPMPRPIILRALAMAVIALALVAAPMFVLLLLVWPPEGNWTELIVYKLVFSVVHAAVLSPLVILAVLRDHGR